jgi:hypothetical protein
MIKIYLKENGKFNKLKIWKLKDSEAIGTIMGWCVAKVKSHTASVGQ